MKSKWAVLARDTFLSIVASFLTACAISAIDRLPYSPTRDTMTDALRMPGGFIAGLFYPQGIHTGSGSPHWADVAVAGNLTFYAIIWFVCIRTAFLLIRNDRLS